MLSNLGAAPRASSAAREPSGGLSDLRGRLDAASPADREALLVAHLRAEATRILGLDPSHPFDVSQPLAELGFDSLMTVELINDLSFVLNRKLPVTLFVDCQTIGEVAARLARSYDSRDGRVTALS
jgi:acyl carrier protein